MEEIMFNNHLSIFGYQVIEAPCMADKVQVRKHKKKRINKKWRKRYGMKEVPWNKFVVFEDKIFCHPKWFEKVKAEINNN